MAESAGCWFSQALILAALLALNWGCSAERSSF